MKRISTDLGEYLIYRANEAGSPDAHDTTRGEWFFQPADDTSGEVFSPGFATAEDAEQAALAWVDGEADEWGPDSAQQRLESGPR